MTPKAVIFDLDGTLVDSLEDLADSMNSILSGFGYPTHQKDAYRYFVGRGIKNLVKSALPASASDEEIIMKCYNAMMDSYAKNCINKTAPYSGVLELLDSLKERGVKMAVFSNKAHPFTEQIVNDMFPGYFGQVEGLQIDELRKPNPSVALRIAEVFGVVPQETIYIGDTDTDMFTAVNAGMIPVGALWGFRKADELKEAGAQYLIAHPEELLQLFFV